MKRGRPPGRIYPHSHKANFGPILMADLREFAKINEQTINETIRQAVRAWLDR